MSDIKIITIYGQFYGKGSELYIVYDKEGLPHQTSLLKLYFRDERTLLTGILEKCYALWSSTEGWWISKLVSVNPHDDRGGIAEVAFCLGQNRPSDGRKAMEFLDKAMDYFVIHKQPLHHGMKDSFDKSFWQLEDTEKWMEENPLQLEPVVKSSIVSGTQPSKKAYRYYSTEEELANIFCYLPQSEYEKYSHIFLIDKQIGVAGSQYDNITDIRVRKIYKIKLDSPESSVIDGGKKFVREGETLTVTFKKEGWEDLREQITVQNTEISYIQGDSFVIRNPESVKLPFSKRIRLQIAEKGSKTLITSGVKVSLNNEFLEKSDQGEYSILLKEGETAKIKVEHEEYEPKTEELKLPIDGNIYIVDMKKKQYKLVFRYGTKLFRCEDTITYSDYKSLKELEGATAKENTITITLRKSNPPTPLEFNPSNNDSPKRKDSENRHKNNSSTSTSYVHKLREKVSNWDPRMVIASVVLCIVLFALCYLLISRYFPSVDPENLTGGLPLNELSTESRQEQELGQDHPDDTGMVANQDSLQQVDIAYLKKEDVWYQDRIKSDRFRNFYESIKYGEIDSICSFYIADNSRVNGYWKTIVNYLNQVNGNDNKREQAINELISAGDGDSINLESLMQTLNKIANSGSNEDKTKGSKNSKENNDYRPSSHEK